MSKRIGLFEMSMVFFQEPSCFSNPSRQCKNTRTLANTPGNFEFWGEVAQFPTILSNAPPFIDNTQGWRKHRVFSKRPGLCPEV
jgi:hypothetical protein